MKSSKPGFQLKVVPGASGCTLGEQDEGAQTIFAEENEENKAFTNTHNLNQHKFQNGI